MKKIAIIAAIAIGALALTQCETKQDPFVIAKDQVGLLNKEVQIKQLDSIFKMDSLVKLNTIENAIGTQGEVEIYEKGGKKLLRVSPFDESDPNSKIQNILIFDDRYTTEKGISTKSTFKDVKENYSIKNILTGINTVIVFLEDNDMYITIDKKQLSENARYDPSLQIEASHIPDNATLKYVAIGWESEENTTE